MAFALHGKRRQTGLLVVALILLAASSTQADITFDLRLHLPVPTGIRSYSDLKTAEMALGTPAGTVLNLDVFAIITNTATSVSQKKISLVQLSELSEAFFVGYPDKLHGDFAANPVNSEKNPVPFVASGYRGAKATNGWMSDINGDGDMDVGNLATSGQYPDQFFAADGGTTFDGAPPGTDVSATWGLGAAEFLLGTAAFTFEEEVSSYANEAFLQLAPRVNAAGAVTSQLTQHWWEDGITLTNVRGNDSRVHVAWPVLLVVPLDPPFYYPPEPSSFVLWSCGAMSLLVLRWRRKRRP